jgi:TRAP-type C4-dicarboxylate transport system permease small subunit
MFIFFMLQVFSRYVLQDPYSWTIEASLIAWLWIVFWCSGLLLTNRDHIRFDMLYGWVRPGVRLAFAAISVAAILAAFLVSLPADVGYVSFMKIERSGTLGIRLDYIFSVYLVFAVAIIVRYAFYAFLILRGVEPDIAMSSKDDAGEEA